MLIVFLRAAAIPDKSQPGHLDSGVTLKILSLMSSEGEQMPIYELKCQKCQAIEEHLLKFSDPKPAACQACGGPLQQVISQTSFSLKGSGWYVTDYKPKSGGEGSASTPAKVSGAEAAPQSSSTETSGTKSEGGASTEPASSPKTETTT